VEQVTAIEPTSLACVYEGEDSEKQTFDFDRRRSQMGRFLPIDHPLLNGDFLYVPDL